MKVKALDTIGNNEFFVEAEYFLRINKAYPNRFKPADEIAEKLLKEVNPDDVDIGVTAADEEKWKKSLEEAQEKERIDRLSKVVSEKLAVLTNKFSKKQEKENEPAKSVTVETILQKNHPSEKQEENGLEFPINNWSKKDLDQMEISQLIAIYNEIYPNKKVPKSKKEIIAEILK